MLGIMILLSLSYFYPLISSYRSSLPDISPGMKSLAMVNSSIAVATTSIPLLVYSLLDIAYFGRNSDRMIRFAIVFASFASFLLQFICKFTPMANALFICTYYWQVWMWTCVSFMSLSHYDTNCGRKVFNGPLMAILSLLYGAALFLELNTIGAPSATLTNVIYALRYASTLGLIVLIAMWFYCLMRRWVSTRKLDGTTLRSDFMTENDWKVALLIMNIVAVASSLSILSLHYGVYSIDFFVAYDVLAVLYSSCLYTYFNFIDQRRASCLSDALETKKTFVRYVSHEIR